MSDRIRRKAIRLIKARVREAIRTKYAHESPARQRQAFNIASNRLISVYLTNVAEGIAQDGQSS